MAVSLFHSSLYQLRIELSGEYPGLDSTQAPEPPNSASNTADEEVLQRSNRLQLGREDVDQLHQCFPILSRQKGLLGTQAVLEGVQADGVLPLWRPRARALQGVPSIGFGFLLAGHDIDPLRSIRVDNVKGIVGQTDCTPRRSVRLRNEVSKQAAQHIAPHRLPGVLDSYLEPEVLLQVERSCDAGADVRSS